MMSSSQFRVVTPYRLEAHCLYRLAVCHFHLRHLAGWRIKVLQELRPSPDAGSRGVEYGGTYLWSSLRPPGGRAASAWCPRARSSLRCRFLSLSLFLIITFVRLHRGRWQVHHLVASTQSNRVRPVVPALLPMRVLWFEIDFCVVFFSPTKVTAVSRSDFLGTSRALSSLRSG